MAPSPPRPPPHDPPAGSPTRGADPPRQGEIRVSRLRVPLPDSAWVARLSRKFPEVRLEVLSRLDLAPGRSLTEVWLQAPEGDGWVDEVRGLPGVAEVEELDRTSTGVRLRVAHRTSPLVPIFRDLHLLRRFPFAIVNGEAEWVVVAPEGKIRGLVERLRAEAPGSSLESLRRPGASDPTRPLTPRQADLLRRALAAGYFEVPRRVTLTELAARLGLAASSLSEALAIVEKKLLERLPPPE